MCGRATSTHLRDFGLFTTPSPQRILKRKRIHTSGYYYLQDLNNYRVSTQLYSAGLTQYKEYAFG